MSKVTQCEWWRHDLNSGSQVPENSDPGHYFVILAHESLPLASRSAIGTLMWRSVFGGTSEGLMRYCQTCSSCWGPWRTARHQSARRSWRKCKARWVSQGPLRTPWGGCCGQQGENAAASRGRMVLPPGWAWPQPGCLTFTDLRGGGGHCGAEWVTWRW